VSVVSLPYPHPPFPFFATDADTGKDVEIKTKWDAYNLFNSWEWDHPFAQERRFLFAQNADIGDILIDQDLQDVIRRKIYCDKYTSVPPFKGAYDDQPDWWFSAVNTIEQAVNEASKYVRRINGH
jgi:hypothetical protein